MIYCSWNKANIYTYAVNLLSSCCISFFTPKWTLKVFFTCKHWHNEVMYLPLLPAQWLTFCGLQKPLFLPCDFHFESVLIPLSTVTILLLPVWYWPVALHIHNLSVLQFWHTQYTHLALLLILHWYRSVVTAVKLICCSYSTDSELQTYLCQICLQNWTVSDMNIFGCVSVRLKACSFHMHPRTS